MVKGDVIFCASGVTSGDLAKGVKDLGNEYEVNSFVLHKSQNTIKNIKVFIINEFTFFKWKILIFKQFNQEYLNFIKDNFSLDEITSKLISIRKIKKEEINSFLNPSIKNFLLIQILLLIWKKQL